MSEKSKEREALTHELKCDRGPFQDILSGSKKAEVRRDDRDFRVGDRLNLLETVNTAEQMRAGAPLEYTGGQDLKRITHVQRGYGLPDGIVVLSFDDDHSEHARHMVAGAAAGALTVIREKLERFEACAGDDEGCDIGREWFDALTTIGLLERTQRSPALWSMTPAGEALLAAQPAADAPKVPEGILDALRFYANGSHFILSDGTAWDTVSGEPPNFWCDEAGTATVEDGSVAKLALQGKFFTDQEYTEPAVEGEVFGAAPAEPAPAARQCQYKDCGNDFGCAGCPDRQGVALSDEEIERTFYPSGSATPN
ncbi:DUF3850 domain-containing protein, partial [Cupriavidus necator]|uniref:DUF3850 domain-containing protein n=1 Tax=Cupriavidus necator TaxID=106590 RepID=UPI001C10E97F